MRKYPRDDKRAQSIFLIFFLLKIILIQLQPPLSCTVTWKLFDNPTYLNGDVMPLFLHSAIRHTGESLIYFRRLVRLCRGNACWHILTCGLKLRLTIMHFGTILLPFPWGLDHPLVANNGRRMRRGSILSYLKFI